MNPIIALQHDPQFTPSAELAAIVGPLPISRQAAVAAVQKLAMGSNPQPLDPLRVSCPPLIVALTGKARITIFGLAASVIRHLK
jgi:hypothetical protein